MLAKAGRMAIYRTAFALDVIASMPAVYRVPILLAVIRSWPYEASAWSEQRPVWEAVSTLPAEDRAPLLLACEPWFGTSALRHEPPEARQQRAAARAEWLAAITGLPAIDALALAPR
jgi:hypothetical protein